MKVLRNFCVAHICVLFPLLWLALGWMPDQVKVGMRGGKNSRVALQAPDALVMGERYGNWKEGTVWRFYLQEGMKWEDLSFRLPEGMDGGDVGWVKLEKWKLLAPGKTGAGLKRKEGMANEYFFPNPRFDWHGFAHGKVLFGLAVSEVMWLLLSWWCAKRHREECWNTLWPAVMGVALALAVLMQVALPVQTYVANRSSFPCGPGEFFGAVAWRFAAAVVLGGMALGLLARCFGRWVLAPVLAFAGCAYLESGILSVGLPSLNGDWTFFADRARGMRDAAVWGAVFVSVVGVHRWLKPWYAVAGLCVAGLAAASIFDAKVEGHADTSNLIVDEFCPIETVVRNAAYSTNRNVMVFVVDSLEREQAHAIMEDPEAGPELREKFIGFTEYVDNVGTANASDYSVANLFTGKYPENALGFPTYFVSVYSAESALNDYLAEDAAVYLGTSALGYGYTNRRKQGNMGDTDRKRGVFDGDGEAWGLADTCRFRWMPFAAKWAYAHLVGFGKKQGGGFKKEWIACPWLGKAPVRPGEREVLLFLHTDGVHVPIQRNRLGNYLPVPDNTDHGAVEMGIYILNELGRLFDIYREKGIYDNSLIVVLADHGNHVHGPSRDARDLPGIARPFLWVKPVGSRHAFSTSQLPTSHARVSSLLKESSHRNLSEEEIQALLSMDERLFRITFGMGTRRDWWVKKDGSVTKESGPLGIAPVDKMQPLRLGHVYSFDLRRSTAGELENIQLSNFLLRFFPRWFADTKGVGIAFKVPDSRGRYDVRIKLAPWLWEVSETESNLRGACFRFRQERDGGDWVEGRTGDTVEITLNNLVPDGFGIIRIAGERDDGIHSAARLIEMEVSMHRDK